MSTPWKNGVLFILALSIGVTLANAQTSCREVSGYQTVSWECYDGNRSSRSGDCFTTERWMKLAQDQCRDRCNSDQSKCGVNSSTFDKTCTVTSCDGGGTTGGGQCGKGYRSPYVKCHDGSEPKPEMDGCGSAEGWQSWAEQVCKGRCSTESGKCGVNTYSIGSECDMCGGATTGGTGGGDRCPTGEELDRMIKDCQNRGMDYEKLLDGQCTWIKCKESTSCICTMEYAPVCGRDGKTYGNKCGARCAKVEVAYDGECRTPPPPPHPPSRTQCWKGSDGCTVKCEDGTTYDVCHLQCPLPQPTPPPECKTYRENGCVVKNCGGKITKSCPEEGRQPPTCKTSRIGSCTIKQCSDGTVKKTCPKRFPSYQQKQ